jgi:hypothetical protein
MDISKSVFQCFSSSDSSSVFDNIRQYLYPQIKQGIMNLFKSFLFITSNQLFNFIVTNDALKPFNSISINNF